MMEDAAKYIYGLLKVAWKILYGVEGFNANYANGANSAKTKRKFALFAFFAAFALRFFRL